MPFTLPLLLLRIVFSATSAALAPSSALAALPPFGRTRQPAACRMTAKPSPPPNFPSALQITGVSGV